MSKMHLKCERPSTLAAYYVVYPGIRGRRERMGLFPLAQPGYGSTVAAAFSDFFRVNKKEGRTFKLLGYC